MPEIRQEEGPGRIYDCTDGIPLDAARARMLRNCGPRAVLSFAIAGPYSTVTGNVWQPRPRYYELCLVGVVDGSVVGYIRRTRAGKFRWENVGISERLISNEDAETVRAFARRVAIRDATRVGHRSNERAS